MNFTTTFSRSQLQAIPAKRRLDAIRTYVDHHLAFCVHNAAAAGKTSYLFVVPKASRPNTYPPEYQLTADDLLEGIRAKFPECDVDFDEEWIDVRPGVREHRSGIKIDWS